MIKMVSLSVWRLFVVLTPLLGVWLASSLATYFGGPRWAAIAAGVLVFPLVPFVWESIAVRRKKKRDLARKEKGKEPRKAWLTTSDRVVLRTLVVNLAFLGALVGLFPQAVFPALSTRGAWFLDGVEDDRADVARGFIFAAAGRLEWLYKVTHPNPYEGLGEGEAGADVDAGNIRPGKVDSEIPDRTDAGKRPSNGDKHPPDGDKRPPDGDKSPPDGDKRPPDGDKRPPDGDKRPPSVETPTKTPSKKAEGGPPRAKRTTWPQSASIHPAAKAAPSGRQVTIATLGAHFRRLPDQRERLRAMHDWVATNISYDLPSIADGTYPRKQSATRVLQQRRGVCAGYANLMSALGEVTGDRIVFVTGHTRNNDGEIPGPNGHAWNAVEIDGAWYLIDVTWDSGLKVGRPPQPMTTTYFLTPPKAFALDHFPDSSKWQLLKTPMSRGDFLRQPAMQPLSVAYGLNVISPQTGRGVSTSDHPSLTFKNPKKYFLIGKAEHEGGKTTECDVVRKATSEVNCRLKQAGRYHVRVFANKRQAGTYAYMGAVVVDQR